MSLSFSVLQLYESQYRELGDDGAAGKVPREALVNDYWQSEEEENRKRWRDRGER